MTRPCRSFLNPQSLTLIGIPPKFHKSDLKSFRSFGDSALLQVKKFVGEYLEYFRIGSPPHGLYICGSNGVGKTHLACVIAKEAYAYRWIVRRVTFVDYVNQYTRMWGAKNTEDRDSLEESFYTSFKGVELLILEEVGKEIDSSIAAPILEDLLRYREDKGLITIICTNFSPAMFKSRYGESCFSLLQGNMVPLTISTVDRREQVLKGEL